MWQESALSRWEHDRCQAADAWASATCGLLAINVGGLCRRCSFRERLQTEGLSCGAAHEGAH